MTKKRAVAGRRSRPLSGTRRSIIAVTGLVVLVGCADAAGPDVESGPRFSEQRQEGSVGSSGDLPGTDIVPRFDLSLSATGSFTPDASITIIATATARYATADMELSIFLPEVEAAKATSWDRRFRLPVGSIPKAGSRRLALVVGQTLSESAVLTVPAAGIYRVVATAKQLAPGQVSDNGRLIADVARRDLWLFVNSTGGRTVSAFDADLVPAGNKVEPGPFRPKRPPADSAPSPRPTRVPGRTTGSAATDSGCPASNICAQVVYSVVKSEIKPVPLPEVYVVWRDELEPQTGYTETVYGDSQGRVRFSCPPGDTYEGTWSVRLTSADVALDPVVSSTGGGLNDSDCGSTKSIQSAPGNSVVYDNFVTAIPLIESLLGRSRPKVTVELVRSGSCRYTLNDDRIRVPSDCYFGDGPRFSHAHEYAHALHHRALGGLATVSKACAKHDFEKSVDLQCAFNEGFADWVGLASVGSGVYALEDSVEANFWLEENGGDGSIQEGAVAAVLWDIADGTNETHDALDAPGSYIAGVIATCDVKQGSAWIDRDGIDHLVYCFENDVDSAITGNANYFPTRSVDPTDEREFSNEPSGWSKAKIRNIWRRNLYDDP